MNDVKLRLFPILGAVLLLTIPWLASDSARAATGDPALLNEVLVSHSGTDDTEFVEIFGTPGLSLSGLSLIVVEGDAFDPGRIDRRFDFKPFHAIGPGGYFLLGNCGGLSSNYGATPDASLFTNYFENSSLTIALVETASLTAGQTQVSGSEVVRDAVALTDGDAGDQFYFGAPVIGPDGTFFPAGARRVVDGVDTDTSADWTIADFFLPGSNSPTGGGFDGCSPISLTIPEIQGDGQFSSYQGEIVTTTGVVTLISANGRDMWIQDPEGDGDPATSDGIFVDDRDRLDPLPEVGDLVRITAEVEELQFGTALPLTRLDDPDDYPFEILSSGDPLPQPVPLIDLPNVSMTEGESFWEPLEGMRVSVSNAFVAAATNGFGEFLMLAEADAVPGSGYYPDSKHLILRSLDTMGSDDDVDYNPERIMVDDTSLAEPIFVTPGDRVRSMVAVVDYTFSNYKLQPDTFDVKIHQLPKLPASTRSGGFGDAVITTYNVENLFDLIDEPAKADEGSTPSADELETRLSKLALAIEIELGLPDILIVQEVENTAILQELGDRVNDANGTDYVATSFETSDVRGIEVGFLWDDHRVDLRDAFQMSGPDVEAAFGPSSPSPGREPLVGVFDVRGKEITIIGNHFKSKSGDDPLYGVIQPPLRVTEAQRKAQARVVRDFVNAILDADPEALVLVAGDLNDFEFGEPGESAIGSEPGHPVGILEGGAGEVPLTNLIRFEKASQRFTFVFDGNGQVLDHILVSPALLGYLQAVDVLHFNTTTPTLLLEDDDASPLSASDHDPLESRFKFK